LIYQEMGLVFWHCMGHFAVLIRRVGSDAV
jgi:hypothetical protein